MDKKSYHEAIHLFSDLLRTEPGNGKVLALRAAAYLGNHEPEKALTDCEQALKLDAKNKCFAPVESGRTLRLG